jgi:hypothetical protein
LIGVDFSSSGLMTLKILQKDTGVLYVTELISSDLYYETGINKGIFI